MEEYYQWVEKQHEKNFELKVKQIDMISRTFESKSPEPKSTIKFSFSFKNTFSLWNQKQESDAQPRHVKTVDHPLKQVSVLVNLDDFRRGDDHGREDTRQLINQKLIKRCWEVIPRNSRREWVGMALDTARVVVNPMPTAHNNVSIKLHVVTTSKFLLDEKLPVSDYMSKYIEILMHPNWDECCICSIEFSGESLSVTTPCDHNFHLNCLKKWLDTNPRCPIYRRMIPEEGKIIILLNRR